MGFLIQLVRIILAVVIGFFASCLLIAVIGERFVSAVVLNLICWVVTWWLLPRLIPAFKKKTHPKLPFEATHRAKNVAINGDTGQVWFRDTKGKEWIFSSDEIRNWSHEWTNLTNNFGQIWHTKNVLVIATRDLDHPTHKIPMGGHSKHELAKEWHERLTAMLHR